MQVGDELTPVVKGPLCNTDMVAFYVGCTPVRMAAHEISLMDYRKHPSWYFVNKETGGLEPIVRVHAIKEAALAAGLPAPYDIGIQRNSWLLHLLTNWVGDEGFVKKCYAEYRLFCYYGDVTWLTIKLKVARSQAWRQNTPSQINTLAQAWVFF